MKEKRILQRFIDYNAKYINRDSGIRAGLAVSGGVDSMLMARLAQLAGWDSIWLHVNYGLRGEESDADQAFVENAAAEAGAEIIVKKMPPEWLSKGNNEGGLQSEARTARYKFFENMLPRARLDMICTAHHMDDNAETVLMQLVKGAAIKGLIGIQHYRHDLRLLRPLMCFTKEEVRQMAADFKVEYREDASNSQSRYQRNIIRNEVMPILMRINPQLQRTLLHMGHVRSDVAEVVEAFSAQQWKHFTHHYLSSTHNDTAAREYYYRSNEHQLNNLKAWRYGLTKLGFTQTQISRIGRIKVDRPEPDKSRKGRYLYFKKEHTHLVIDRAMLPEPDYKAEFSLPALNEWAEHQLPGGIKLHLRRVPYNHQKDFDTLLRLHTDTAPLVFPFEMEGCATYSRVMVGDAKTFGDRIIVMPAQTAPHMDTQNAGILIPGLKGHKKVKKLLQERKLHPYIRRCQTIMMSADTEVQVVTGLAQSANFVLKPETEQALIITLTNTRTAMNSVDSAY